MPELFQPTKFSVRPEKGRGEPRLWVKRFCIWSEPGTLPVREIHLRQGLNIIWSPDPNEGKGPIGHGAGKTTLCRLLRYCLGEDTFGSRDQRMRIHTAFPKGQVGIELMLDGEMWAVLRSINGRTRDIVLRDSTLEQAQEANIPTTMEPLISVVQDQLLIGVAELMPSRVSSHEVWQAVLAWLSRDQECRLSHPLEWRDPASESLSPVRDLSKSQTLQIVRALTRSVSKEELSTQQESDHAENDSERYAAKIERLDWQIQRTQIALVAALGADLPTGIGPLDMALLEQKVRDSFPELSVLQAGALNKARREASVEREEAYESLSQLRSDLRLLEQKKVANEGLLAIHQAQLARDNRGVILAENAPCPVCEVPLNRVLDEGCPCTVETGYIEEVRARRQETVGQIQSLGALLGSTDTERSYLLKAISAAEALLSERRLAEAKIEDIQDRESATSREGDRLLEKAKELHSLSTERAAAILESSRENQIREERSTQVHLLRKHNDNMVKLLSQRFDAVIRELLPGDIQGTVLIDGNGLSLKVLQGGERSTAAIDSLKVVAFDIAALILAIEGSATLPAFLLHDSPREADLGQSIYDRLFMFMVHLEEMAPFQYIVTTTTQPPVAVTREPWLRVILRGGPASDRLMGCDL